MNEHSYIARFIRDNPDDWVLKLRRKDIRVRKEGPFFIFNYNPGADFRDPVAREARGIIIEGETLDVVCWPFDKFQNWFHELADPIDWGSARVQEKCDGSIVKLWFRNGETHWSTNSCVDANKAELQQFPGNSYFDLLRKADNYWDIPNQIPLSPDKTYIFELTSPWNQIVVPYSETKLTLLGIRNNLTGKEERYEGKFKTPVSYPFTSFSDCQKYLKKKNKNGEITDEGFVVVDKDFHRIKIKTDEYFLLSHVAQRGKGGKRELMVLFFTNRKTYEFIKNTKPHIKVTAEFYEAEYKRILLEVEKTVDSARYLYETTGGDQKALALSLRDNPYRYFGFRAIDYPNETPEEMLEGSPDRIEKTIEMIPDFIVNEDFQNKQIEGDKQYGTEIDF